MTTPNDRYYRGYFPMQPVKDGDKVKYEEMEIEVYYSLGGHNIWTGGTNRRGVYLSFWPVVRDKTDHRAVTSVTRTVGDDRGRRMLLVEQKRRQDTVGAAWGRFVKDNLTALGEASVLQDWAAVAHIVRQRLEKAA